MFAVTVQGRPLSQHGGPGKTDRVAQFAEAEAVRLEVRGLLVEAAHSEIGPEQGGELLLRFTGRSGHMAARTRSSTIDSRDNTTVRQDEDGVAERTCADVL